MKTDLCYVSAACNSTPSICDWGNNGLMCYGSCNSVIIYNPKHCGTSKDVKILIGHTKRVNAVKWIRCNEKNETEIVSGSVDGTAIVWSLIGNEYKPVVLKNHEDGVNVVGGLYVAKDQNELIVVTASVDSTVRIWKRTIYGENVTAIQTIHLERGLCLTLTLTFLPHSSNILLACGRDNSKIELYSQFVIDDLTEFKLVALLKGHENWVRSLDFVTKDDGNVLLASSSQDAYIRIWCIFQNKEDNLKKSALEILNSHTMRAMESNFSVNSEYFTVHLESILPGHEGWIYQVNWHPKIYNKDGGTTQPMKILSSSLDKTMIIWTHDDSTGLWMESVRVGEVGGNTLGFYGSGFSPDGQSIFGHGYLGSFHMWSYCSKTQSWRPSVSPSGHSNEVVDIAWESNGMFLMSASLDQTTRIHAPWLNNNEISWHELARPQVHGYDMSCLSMLSRYKFVSGAEEKIIRAFKAPSNFIANFRRICNVTDDAEGNEILKDSTNGPKGASVPSLGLSNKAVFDSNNEVETKGKDSYPEDSYFHEIYLEAPPMEEDLLQNTLWPEIQKLYGHGYEIFALAASNNGKLVASACKATSPEHAAIILWDADTWQQKQKLLAHTLTVTQIMFSPDDKKLLSVSRDRRWTIFERNEIGEFAMTATTDKKTGIHSRIIWCCAWSHDSAYFATGSRDGKAVIWRKNENKVNFDTVLGLYEAVGMPVELKGESITAIAFAPINVNDRYLLCLGLESGVIKMYTWSLESSWDNCCNIEQSLGHHLTVKRIFFRPRPGMAGVDDTDKENKKILQIASCSSDHSVKIHNLYLNEEKY